MRRLDPKQTTDVVTIRLPRKLAQAVARRARQERRSRSDLLRELITAGMGEPSVEAELKLLRQDVQALRAEVRKLGRKRKGGG